MRCRAQWKAVQQALQLPVRPMLMSTLISWFAMLPQWHLLKLQTAPPWSNSVEFSHGKLQPSGPRV